MSDSARSINSPSEEPPEKESRSRLSLLVALLSAVVVGGALILVGSAFIYTLATKVSWGEAPAEGAVPFPLVGQSIKVKNVQTAFTPAGGSYRPTANIVLDPSSANGQLRIVFRTDQDRMSGSPIDLPVVNGKFQTGATIKVIGDGSGIPEEGALRGYLTDQTDLWYVVIEEVTASSDAKELARIPIARKIEIN